MDETVLCINNIEMKTVSEECLPDNSSIKKPPNSKLGIKVYSSNSNRCITQSIGKSKDIVLKIGSSSYRTGVDESKHNIPENFTQTSNIAEVDISDDSVLKSSMTTCITGVDKSQGSMPKTQTGKIVGVDTSNDSIANPSIQTHTGRHISKANKKTSKNRSKEHKNGGRFHHNAFKYNHSHFYPPSEITMSAYHHQGNSPAPYEEIPYYPDVLFGGYLVTSITGCIGVNLQSPEQQQQHVIMRGKLNNIWFNQKRIAISQISEDKNMVYLAYDNGDVYRTKIVKPIEGRESSYFCSDIDTGKVFRAGIKYLHELHEDLKAPPLSEYRLLKNVYIPIRYKENRDDRQKIYSYVSNLLIGKHITVANPTNNHVDIYYMNDHLNPKIRTGLQQLLTETNDKDISSNLSTLSMNQVYRENDDGLNSKALNEIPTSSCLKMDIRRRNMYNPNNCSQYEEKNGSTSSTKQNFSSLVNLIFKNFERRDMISERISNDSAIFNASQYILKNSSFYAEIDDLLAKGNDLLGGRFNTRIRNDKTEKFLTDFYTKRHLINVTDIEASLKNLYADLAVVCTDEEMQEARQERMNESANHLDKPFYTFISIFNSWKANYETSQTNTDKLLKSFMSGQNELIKWVECLLQKKSDSKKTFSFDYIQKLHEQLINEGNLAGKQNWIALSVLMMNDEIKRRLNKIASLLKISEEIDRRYDGCSYQKNKQFSNETSVPLLSFIKSPKALSPEVKCFFICDIYRELAGYHRTGVIYKYLNPSNVLIISHGEATLREPSKVETGEPFPPWSFIAPECNHLDSIVSTEADSYSLGQFILWLACVQVNKNFDHEMRRIKHSCPIFDKIANDNPLDRPSLQEIEKSFATIFPKAFGVIYSENYSRLPQTNKNNETENRPVKILQSYRNNQSKIEFKKSPSKAKNNDELENMKYELSLLRELQDSDDSQQGDLEDDLASMIALSRR